jgi:hypothetical protein
MSSGEKRCFERYHPPKGAVAALNPFAEFGVISDVGRGGLAFDFLPLDQETDLQVGVERTITIFVPDDKKRHLTIPCRIVHIVERLLGSYSQAVIRKKRCGVEFLMTKSESTSALNGFVEQCIGCERSIN